MNDVLLAKTASLERCVRQARRYYSEAGQTPFEEDFMRQDAVALNIQRACELGIDMANHLIKVKKLGLPQDSRESFLILAREQVISADLGDRLARMVGFRNVLVHRYQELDIAIMRSVIEMRLDDLLEFARMVLDGSV